ncbi:MAG: BlaI/MecI/CopY family transcriptional regulator [Thermoguttaceae bacterium]
MSETNSLRLGDLQLRIMRVLWRSGPLGVAEVRDRLHGDDLAYTTVATMLRKMEDRGLVAHDQADRRFIYRAAVDQDDVTRKMADDLVDRLFEGSLAQTVSHLLQTRQVDEDELSRLESLIRSHRARKRK